MELSAQKQTAEKLFEQLIYNLKSRGLTFDRFPALSQLTNAELKVTSYQGSSSSEDFTTPVLQFLNDELRSKSDSFLQDEYPSLYRGLPGGESLFIEREQKVISHVGIMSRRYRHPSFEMEIGLIGSVVTRKEQRGEGLASFLIQEAIKRLSKQGCTLVLLWSDQPDFYFPLGFHRAGNELDFRISLKKAEGSRPCSRLLNKEKDLELIWKLYQKRSSRLDRSLAEMSALVDIPRTQIYVTESNGKLDSYIAVNKGADFTNYIHEWSGSVERVKGNIQDCQNRFFSGVPLTLIAPFEKENETFSEIADQSWKGSLGLVKNLDRTHLVKCFKSFCGESGGFVSETDYLKLNDEELLLAVLGRDGLGSKPFLPLFLWGFDSI